MSWLKKLGQVVAAGSKVAGTFVPVVGIFGPMIDAMLPGDQSKIISGAQVGLNQLVSIAAIVETMGTVNGLSGADKFKTATPLITQLILRSDFMLTHKIQDAAMFEKAMMGFTQATVDLSNSLDATSIP